MDTQQILSLILSVLTLGSLVVMILFIAKGNARRDAALESQAKFLARLVEIEGSMKGALPAIERNTGASVQQLAAVLPVVEKAVVAIGAEVIHRLPAIQASALAAERTGEKMTVDIHRIAEAVDQLVVRAERAVESTAQAVGRLGDANGKLEMLHKQAEGGATDSAKQIATLIEAVRAVENALRGLSRDVATSAKGTTEAVEETAKAVGALRQSLLEAVKF